MARKKTSKKGRKASSQVKGITNRPSTNKTKVQSENVFTTTTAQIPPKEVHHRPIEFDTELKQKIKTINNRLKKLERTYNDEGVAYSKLSGQYRTMQEYATREVAPSMWQTASYYNNTVNSKAIYDMDRLYGNEEKGYKGGEIRLINNKEDFDKLTWEQKKKLVDVVESIWNNPDSTTTITNINKFMNKSFKTFKENHPEAEDLTSDQYAQMWQIYTDQVRADKNTHFGSSDVIMLLRDFNVSQLLTDNQYQEALKKMSAGKAKAINRKYRKRI